MSKPAVLRDAIHPSAIARDLHSALPWRTYSTVIFMSDGTAKILPFPKPDVVQDDPVVITGIGIAASIGDSRESVWQAVQCGKSGIRESNENDGVGDLRLPCGMIDWLPPEENCLKTIQLSRLVAQEALTDSGVDLDAIDRGRFACSVAAQLGDIRYVFESPETRDTNPANPWWNQFLPCTATGLIGREFGLHGPRLGYSTACASGLVSTMAAARSIQSGQADFALCGAADAISYLVMAAFNRMGVLSTGPEASSACKPFDKERNGFVLGEGAAMLVLERRSTAIARGAKIYAEIAATQALCQAHHVTGLDGDAEALCELIGRLNERAGWSYRGPQYINAHGTGTEQNDHSEMKAIRAALGSQADNLAVSSNKAVVGHLINAAGSIELALTAMSLRDGFAPPTMHLQNQEETGQLDCLPDEGLQLELDRAMKLSLAFGGHLVGIALRRSPFEQHQRLAEPLHSQARVRQPQPAFRRAA